MKIFLATSEAPPAPSGMARVCEKLTAGFRLRGHSVDVLAGSQLPRIMLSELRLMPLTPHWGWVHERAARADVISLHGPIPTFSDFFLMMSRLQGDLPPIGYTHHMNITFRLLGPLMRAYSLFYRDLVRHADTAIVSTRAMANMLRDGGWREELHVVPFGVELERVVCAPKAAEFTALFVGQLRPYKGVDVLLKAMRRLPGLRLRIAGTGYAEAQYRAMAARFGLENVEFLGRVSDDELWKLYASSHIFVLPSTDMEYFGLVLLEAMASGCVPVISDNPGPSEVVGDLGHIVPRLSVGALAEAIADLRDNPGKVAEQSERARARAATMTWDTCVERYLALYEGIRN